VWLRNHKAAGSSIYHAIEASKQPDFLAQTDPNAQVYSDKYERWKQWMQGGFDTDEYYIFMITRDPYSRFASACRYLKHTPSQMIKYLSIWRGHSREWRHTRPQTHYLFDCVTPIIASEPQKVVGYQYGAKLPVGSVDFIDIKDLQDRWGQLHKQVKASSTLTYLNTSMYNPINEKWEQDDELYRFVNTYYKEDFDQFGYKMQRT
jgi:hypothetical protein